MSQGASRTTEEGKKKEGKDREERAGGGQRGAGGQALPPGPNPPAANGKRNEADAAPSNLATRGVQQSGEDFVSVLMHTWALMIPSSVSINSKNLNFQEIQATFTFSLSVRPVSSTGPGVVLL